MMIREVMCDAQIEPQMPGELIQEINPIKIQYLGYTIDPQMFYTFDLYN